MLERGSREFDSGPAGRPVRDHADIVDGFHRGAGDHEDPYLLKVSGPEATNDPGDNRVNVGHLRLVFVPPRVDKLKTEIKQAADVRGDGRVSLHALGRVRCMVVRDKRSVGM